MKKILIALFGAACVYQIANATPIENKKKAATKIYGLERFYYASLPDNARKAITRTPKYKEALSHYYDSKNYKSEKISYIEKGEKKSKKVAFPNFKKVEDMFIQSYITEENRAAGFIAAYLHKNYGDLYSLKGQLKYFHIVSSLAKDGNCFGYVETAKYFSQGIADIPQNTQEALRILKTAQNKCSKTLYAHSIKKEIMLNSNGFYKDISTQKE